MLSALICERLMHKCHIISLVISIASKLQKSSFMYVTYCKLCPLSSIITKNVLHVCNPLQVMSFRPNSVNFCG
ncbi:hypothetical protein Hanom_Chr09g00816271 [Helianthus anomalus]